MVSAESAANSYGVTATAARAALNQLQAVGVLQPTRVGRRRDREWISDELFQLLDTFEYNLGEPEVEDGADRRLCQLGCRRRPGSPTTGSILVIVFSFLILLVTMMYFAFVY